jgi:pimeloyl-ACP methyl ester carboxylesterase
MPGPTIVLVHGAFADASGFRGLYNELHGEDATIIAPPNPLRGLSGGDGEYLRGVIDAIDGPVLLVGHSYGGSVITAAGTADNVVGLVYISGFAPDEGENLTDLQSKFPPPGRMGATITEIEDASHVVMISQPKKVAEVVKSAVRACAHAAGMT